MSKTYTLSEVSKHRSRDDAWLIIEGRVLDITRFLHEHPGGEDVLLDVSGRDASREFAEVGHSPDARARLNDLVIGTLVAPDSGNQDDSSMNNTPEPDLNGPGGSGPRSSAAPAATQGAAGDDAASDLSSPIRRMWNSFLRTGTHSSSSSSGSSKAFVRTTVAITASAAIALAFVVIANRYVNAPLRRPQYQRL